MFYSPPTIELLKFFGIGEWSTEKPINETVNDYSVENETLNMNNETDFESNEGRNPWSKTDILKLINLYKKYEGYFKSTTVKNEKVWQWIAKDMKTHTSEQCRNKFKYLKGKYVAKKDNMGNRSTGTTALKFEYFKEFDEIFRGDANITPIALASSSKGEANMDHVLIEGVTEGEDTLKENENPKKRKRSLLEKQLSKYEQHLEERETAVNKRHKEILARQDQALDIFSRVANAFEKFVDRNNP